MNTNLDKIKKAITERDKKDAETEKKNQKNMVKAGLNLHRPKRIIRINTGKVIGVLNVVNLIARQLKEGEKIISIEGVSGCGKTSTAETLAKKIGANQISAGEIFRYLTYCLREYPGAKPEDILLNLSTKVFRDRICLYRDKENVSVKFKNSLHTHNIDIKVADVAKIYQAEVLKFMSKEIERLVNNSQHKIIIDGRAYSLDFLPSDLRIILYADEKVRAERRLKQNNI